MKPNTSRSPRLPGYRRLIYVTLAILISAALVSASTTRRERATLRSLNDLNVTVEYLHQGDIEIEIPAETIRAEIQQRLIHAGLDVNPKPEPDEYSNILVVSISVLRPEMLGETSHVYVFCADLALRQRVSLTRQRWIRSSAITWLVSVTGTADAATLTATIRRSMALNVGKFLEDYHQVND